MEARYLTPLTPDEQRAFGLIHAAPFAMADRVRFSEIDILRHVNNKAYLDWCESVRVHYFNETFLSHFDGAERPRNVVRSASIHYVKEMTIEESYLTTARVLSFRRTSYVLEQQIWAGDLRATYQGVMVFRTPDGGAGYPIPDSLRQQFIDQDGAEAMS